MDIPKVFLFKTLGMELIINHKKKFFENTPKSLEDLLLQEGLLQAKGIAIALNHQVVTKDNWASTLLHTNDTILIITATQGG